MSVLGLFLLPRREEQEGHGDPLSNARDKNKVVFDDCCKAFWFNVAVMATTANQ